MKKFATLLLFTAALAAAACSGNDADPASDGAAGGNVRFVASTPQAAAVAGPVYASGDFRILAFRNDGTDYVYLKEIPLTGFAFDGKTLSGTAQLPAGDYKFLPSYGLVTEGNYAWPELTAATALSDALYVTHTQGSFPAVFMLNTALDGVPVHTVSLDSPLTVSSTLRRSVSRVDVLFIRADKGADGSKTEKEGDDVFGPEKLGSVVLTYTDANSHLGLSGEKVDGVFNTEHTIAEPSAVLTMGTGTKTTLGAEGYDYENVQADDIIAGSAHLKGTYLIPNADAAKTVGCKMVLTSGKGTTRTIDLADKLPVERNKATLIRVYVLGENVFTTGVDFAVEVVTAWDGSNVVDGEID